ncbi:MAG: glycosyltransferase family 4 protein [Verrucomicrobia bacterium]|nr:glycosyltransferase family 4 protein [Verrucomicrobiota bacterium]
MKIILDCHVPAMLAHGGAQIQMEQTRLALQTIGVEAEFLRWWDPAQTGDIIHFCGRMPVELIRFAQKKKIKVVMADLLTASGSQTPWQRGIRRTFRRGVEGFAPRMIANAFGWESYRLADVLIALTPWEKHLMEYKFGARAENVFVVPNGVEEVFFQSPKTARGEWLVCTATITERKRVLELAEAAVIAQTPVWILGKAYAEGDSYAQQFFRLARENPKFIRYEGGVGDRVELARIYRAARGFVLLSAMESLSLSALEAAACECPLLLSDLPWARSSFTGAAEFCPATGPAATTAAALKKFYAAAPNLPAPPRPATWPDVARQLKAVYEKVLADKR